MCLGPVMTLTSCCCQCCCACCSSTFGSKSVRQQIRFVYVFLTTIFIIIGLLLLYVLSPVISILNWVISCQGDSLQACLGVSAVYRMSFALASMYLLILWACTMRNECSRVINEELWALKIFGILIVFILLFWIPNSFFQVYSQIAIVLSAFFLLFQIVMIIDICYIWGERWISYYDEGQSFWAFILIVTTGMLYGGFIWFTVMLYESYGGCGVGTFAITFNVVLVGIVTLLMFLGIHKNGSLLTTGGVSMFTTYLTWSGLTSQNESCNTSATSGGSTTVQICVGSFLILISLIYMSFGNSQESSGNLHVGRNVDLAGPILEDKQEAGDNEKEMDAEKALDKENQEQKEESSSMKPLKGKLKDYQGNKYVYFHLIMTLASIYIAVLLTNYGNAHIGQNSFLEFESNELSMWIKLGTAWSAMFLYIWTLVAPRIFPDREF